MSSFWLYVFCFSRKVISSLIFVYFCLEKCSKNVCLNCYFQFAARQIFCFGNFNVKLELSLMGCRIFLMTCFGVSNDLSRRAKYIVLVYKYCFFFDLQRKCKHLAK